MPKVLLKLELRKGETQRELYFMGYNSIVGELQ